MEQPCVRVVRTFPRSLPKHIGPWAEFVGNIKLELAGRCRRLGGSPAGEVSWEEIVGGDSVMPHELVYEFRMAYTTSIAPDLRIVGDDA